MSELSQFLSPALMEKLKSKIAENSFPGIDFRIAMEFILNDGLIPESGLPPESFLRLETWWRNEGAKSTRSYSATELKNKTGEILEQVLRGHTVVLHKHGRAVAEIRPIHRE